jgi:hypothetical protein
VASGRNIIGLINPITEGTFINEDSYNSTFLEIPIFDDNWCSLFFHSSLTGILFLLLTFRVKFVAKLNFTDNKNRPRNQNHTTKDILLVTTALSFVKLVTSFKIRFSEPKKEGVSGFTKGVSTTWVLLV